jgi:hexulose-6-phosphate isomerase
MRKSITLRAFPPGLTTLERVRLARAAGYQGVEINLEPGGEFTLDSSEGELAGLAREIRALGVEVSSAYSRQQWHIPITSEDPATRRKGQAIVEALVRAAEALGTDTVLIVPGAVDNGNFANPPEIVPYEAAYRNAQAVLREVAVLAQQLGVCLAVENVWNKFLLSPLELARFVDELGPAGGIYLDVGNVLRTGYPEDWIRIFGKRIRRVHVKDFRVGVDTLGGFVGLLEGDVNWPAVRAALEGIRYDGWLTAEVLPAYRYHGERLIYETSASIDAIFGL